jgi:hypothetical protein
MEVPKEEEEEEQEAEVFMSGREDTGISKGEGIPRIGVDTEAEEEEEEEEEMRMDVPIVAEVCRDNLHEYNPLTLRRAESCHEESGLLPPGRIRLLAGRSAL